MYRYMHTKKLSGEMQNYLYFVSRFFVIRYINKQNRFVMCPRVGWLLLGNAANLVIFRYLYITETFFLPVKS
jgi:hypothetical protein